MPTNDNNDSTNDPLTLAALAEPSRKELTKEDDVKNFMAQIKALETKIHESQALPEGASDMKPITVTQPPIPPATLGGATEAPPSAAPPAAPVPTQPQEPPWRHNVVQVIDKTSRHFGQFFALGDIKNGKAHGYAFKQGGREYITVNVDQIFTVGGSAKIRLGKYCSPKWVMEHMETQ